MLFYRLLEQAVLTEPVSYRQLVVNPQPKPRRPTAPTGRRPNPATLARQPASRYGEHPPALPELDGDPLSTFRFLGSILGTD